jgi:hypothetical protein
MSLVIRQLSLEEISEVVIYFLLEHKPEALVLSFLVLTLLSRPVWGLTFG